MNTTINLFLLVFCITLASYGQKKEFDRDINYDEGKVPVYVLPELLRV